MILISSWSRLCPILWSHVLSREWRCSWSSADRRCSNYIWVIDSSIAYQGASYIRDLTVTQWGRDKMAAIFQTTLSNAFSCMKMLQFQLRYLWSLFLRVQLTIVHHWFWWWLGTDQATSHYLNQWLLVYWRIYASLGLNELSNWIHFSTCNFIC